MSGMNITAKDVVEIIKAAKNSKVKHLKFETLEMEFDTDIHPNKTKNTSHTDVTVEGVMAQLHGPETSEDVLDEDEYLLNETLDQLAIEDPAQHEELQLRLINRGSAS